MLAVVLAGIGFGGIVAGAIHRRSAQTGSPASVLLLLAAIATLLSYLFFPQRLAQSRTGVFDLPWPVSGPALHCTDVPRGVLSGILFPSLVADVQSERGRPNEQHRDYDAL